VRPRTLRVLLVQDSTGHSTGYHVVARGLRDAGHEVILGGALLPREIARLAGEEGVDAIGYRIMDASPALLVERLAGALARAGRGDEAVRHWQRYLELDAGSPWARIARAHLEVVEPDDDRKQKE